jgi:hypothetical protein
MSAFQSPDAYIFTIFKCYQIFRTIIEEIDYLFDKDVL